MHHEVTTSVALLVGAGAANLTVPTTNPGDNFAASGTRSATGTYAIVLKEFFPRILAITPTVTGTDGKTCHVVSWVESTKTVNIITYNAAGTATDLASTDTLRLIVMARESLA